MSFKDNPCRKFQANIFNKSKCQNCFKPRESHLLNEEDLTQVCYYYYYYCVVVAIIIIMIITYSILCLFVQ